MRASRVGDVSLRFWSRVEKLGPDDCWDWKGKPSASGYGRIGGELNGVRIADKCRTQLAHRVSWLIHNGPIPEDGPGAHGWVVMHKCDNRLCVNPAHLQLGTQQDNIQDMDEKQRGNRSGLTSGVGFDNRQFSLSREQVAMVIESRKRSKDLAEELGVSQSVIQKARKRYMPEADRKALESEIRKRGALKGANVPNARLNDDLVREIRASSITNEAWSKRLGMSETTIAQARRRQTFKHVT